MSISGRMLQVLLLTVETDRCLGQSKASYSAILERGKRPLARVHQMFQTEQHLHHWWNWCLALVAGWNVTCITLTCMTNTEYSFLLVCTLSNCVWNPQSLGRSGIGILTSSCSLFLLILFLSNCFSITLAIWAYESAISLWIKLNRQCIIIYIVSEHLFIQPAT